MDGPELFVITGFDFITITCQEVRIDLEEHGVVDDQAGDVDFGEHLLGLVDVRLELQPDHEHVGYPLRQFSLVDVDGNKFGQWFFCD